MIFLSSLVIVKVPLLQLVLYFQVMLQQLVLIVVHFNILTKVLAQVLIVKVLLLPLVLVYLVQQQHLVLMQ